MQEEATTQAIPQIANPCDRAQTCPDTAEVADDRTGRSRLVSNVSVTWIGQMIYLATGFVMPRMIDHKLGQEVLGVWDFCWSLVAYFRFVDMGIITSVNRYVARLWAQKDIAGINRVVSSSTVALVLTASLMLLGTVVVVMTLPYWFGDHLSSYVGVTQKSIFCLGLMLSVNSAVGGYNGVLTGCHRWELQTMRNVGWYVISVIGMLLALWMGGGLVALAAITAFCTIMGHVTVVALAYRVCPGLKLRRADVRWSTIKELYTYGGKTLVPTISEMLLNQATSLLVMGSLGPAALAIFTRPRSLLRQVDALERKMAMILVPMTSSLEGSGQLKQLEYLMVKSVRYSIFLVLPMVIMLVFFGGELMQFWMGPDYRNWALLAILGIGFLGTSVQTPIFSLLSGLNAHGAAGSAQLVGSVVAAGSVFTALKIFHGGVESAALALTVPLLAVNLIYLPMLLCRRLGQNLGTFYRDVALHPVLYVLPFAVCVAIGRWLFPSHQVAAIFACLTGATVLAVFYWRKVLPDRVKSSVFSVRTRVARFRVFSQGA
jgi:O-antigen/teichoic acid export membrane protein